MNRKKSSSSNPPFVDGKHNMTCLQLCEGDDLATMMTVDAVLGFTTHKMDKNYNPSAIDKKTREKWKETMQEFIVDLNYDNAYNQLIASDKVKSNLKKDERFKRHIFRFLYLFDKRSGIKISPCYRYENEGRKGAAIFATKEWERGSQISTLFGCIAEMRPEEEEIFHESKNEFSVMYSTRKNCSQLWLGPAAYVNHDCKPNCRFTEGNDDSKMTLETLRVIHPGDELLIYYGNNFFGTDNAECECFTCELRDQGLFSRNFQNSLSRTSLPPMVETRTKHDQCQNVSLRHIATRSCKLPPVIDRARLSLPNHVTGGVNRLRRSDETYSLRVTYSRIDRVKKKILSRTQNHNPTSVRDSLKLKISGQKTSKPVAMSINGVVKTLCNGHVTTTPSLRRSQRQAGVPPSSNTATAATTDSQWGKLTIKLRKNAGAPGQYERRANDDCQNIFSRLQDLYRCPPESGGTAESTPPCLSPWFCQAQAREAPRAPSRPVRVKRPRSPVAAPASDIPSSPTIPVLEMESDTEHLSTPCSVLMCQLRDPATGGPGSAGAPGQSGSPNKVSVMRLRSAHRRPTMGRDTTFR